VENNYKLRKNENPLNGLKYGVGISELAVLTHIPFLHYFLWLGLGPETWPSQKAVGRVKSEKGQDTRTDG
jgi:hypothetical protein